MDGIPPVSFELVKSNILDRIQNIRIFAFDVDGVLTDGGVTIDGNGAESVRFHVHDGAGISIALADNYRVAWITGRKVEAVARRASNLKVEELHQGITDKVTVLRTLAEKYALTADQILYMGDDILDLPAFAYCGLAAAPSNAARDVLDRVHITTNAHGGKGAVREIIEIVMRGQERWEPAVSQYLSAKLSLRQ